MQEKILDATVQPSYTYLRDIDLKNSLEH